MQKYVPPIPFRIINPDLELDEDREFFSPIQEPGEYPVFTMSEVAKVFYGRSRVWLKEYTLANPEYEPRKSKSGKRQYQLRDIEVITQDLFERAIIDVRRTENALLIVKAIAANYHL